MINGQRILFKQRWGNFYPRHWLCHPWRRQLAGLFDDKFDQSRSWLMQSSFLLPWLSRAISFYWRLPQQSLCNGMRFKVDSNNFPFGFGVTSSFAILRFYTATNIYDQSRHAASTVAVTCTHKNRWQNPFLCFYLRWLRDRGALWIELGLFACWVVSQKAPFINEAKRRWDAFINEAYS